MDEEPAFDAPIHEVCVVRGWCGGIIDDRPMHVTDLLPKKGQVTADEFAALLCQAEEVDPDEDRAKWQPHLDGLRDAFVRHLGSEEVEAERLQ